MKTIMNIGTGMTAVCTLAVMPAAPAQGAPGSPAAITTSPRQSAPEARPQAGGADSATCYANCDDSTTVPYLNANDFTCFLNRCAAGQTDGVCIVGGCNILAYMCFLNKYAAGCSAP